MCKNLLGCCVLIGSGYASITTWHNFSRHFSNRDDETLLTILFFNFNCYSKLNLNYHVFIPSAWNKSCVLHDVQNGDLLTRRMNASFETCRNVFYCIFLFLLCVRCFSTYWKQYVDIEEMRFFLCHV